VEFDKVNAFLATAVGGLIFKWLASAVKSCWSWLNRTYPDEKFLIDEIGIKKTTIRLSHFKYKMNTKKYSKKEIIILATYGITIIIISLSLALYFAQYLIKNPINWLSYHDRETQDSFLIQPERAINTPNEKKWEITSDTCLSGNISKKPTNLSEKSLGIICDNLLLSENREAIKREINNNRIATMVLIPTVLLSIIFFLSIGIGVFINIYINKKIELFNKREREKSYQYLT